MKVGHSLIKRGSCCGAAAGDPEWVVENFSGTLL